MTALPQYERLEAEGRYLEDTDGMVCDVIVKFGDASLMILDMDEMPVTHWPLATLRAAQDDASGLTLAPDDIGAERLVITDETMINALRTVCPELGGGDAAEPQRRHRLLYILGGIGVVIYLAVFQLLPFLSDRIAERIPPAAEAAMGESMAQQFARRLSNSAGGAGVVRFCAAPAGKRALRRLTARLEMAAPLPFPFTIRILDHDAAMAFALPGGQIMLTSGLLDAAQSPEEVAGVLAHEAAHSLRHDPARLALRSAGISGFVDVILGKFTGAGASSEMAQTILQDGYDAPTEAGALEDAAGILAKMGLPTTPVADFSDRLQGASLPGPLWHFAATDAGASADALRQRDTIGDQPFEPALSDQRWVALRGICR